MLPHNHRHRSQVGFDDPRLVANAGLLLPATLARHRGLGELVDHRRNPSNAPVRGTTGGCINDDDVLRAGGMAGVPAPMVKASSTPGTVLRPSIRAPTPFQGFVDPALGLVCLGERVLQAADTVGIKLICRPARCCRPCACRLALGNQPDALRVRQPVSSCWVVDRQIARDWR